MRKWGILPTTLVNFYPQHVHHRDQWPGSRCRPLIRIRLLDLNRQTPGVALGLSSTEEIGGIVWPWAVFRYHNVGARGGGGLETISMLTATSTSVTLFQFTGSERLHTELPEAAPFIHNLFLFSRSIRHSGISSTFLLPGRLPGNPQATHGPTFKMRLSKLRYFAVTLPTGVRL